MLFKDGQIGCCENLAGGETPEKGKGSAQDERKGNIRCEVDGL